MAIPAASASRVLRMATVWPSTSTLPLSGWYTPLRIFISVDLPAPFSPISAWISPPCRVKSTLSSTRTGPKALQMPRMLTFIAAS